MSREEDKDATYHDLELVQLALSGDSKARRDINASIAPIIHFNTQRFCKRFCQQNYLKYRCSLPEKPLSSAKERVLCEWGNASYGWMLDELVSEKRLASYRAENNASFYHYCYLIANSVAFFERWKNWRFGRRSYVPAYIESIDNLAAAVFLALQKGDGPEQIAQNLGISQSKAALLSKQVVIELTKRQKLYLLDTPKMLSMSAHDEDDGVREIAIEDDSAIFQQQLEKLSTAWLQLTEVEQFVIESMMLEKQDANIVLQVLKEQAETTPDVQLEKINDRQSLYYFRRKSFEKLCELANGNSKTE